VRVKGNIVPRDLVPELHDVLKLTTLEHNFSDFDPYQSLAPNIPTWRGVLQHHCKESFPAYPSDRDTFLLHLADGLAASFSRDQQRIHADSKWTVHRLWNAQRVVKDERLDNPIQIRGMLEFLGTDPSFDEFYSRYKRIFQTRAEDAHPGMNITTLETHVRLVGRFYRTLRLSKVLSLTDEEVHSAASRGVPGVDDLRTRKKQEWQLHMLHCHIRLLTNPYTARDMNVFDALQEFLSEVTEKLGDKVLFASSGELLLYSDSVDVLSEMREYAAPRGIVLDVRRERWQVKDLSADFRKPEFEVIYPALSDDLAPPLCEICQMMRATKVWPDDYLTSKGPESEVGAEGKDLLCETCFSIRSRPSRLKKLAHWHEWASGDLVWVRVNLDFDRLRDILGKLYLEYLRTLDANTPEGRAGVRFSLLAEFQLDYEDFLADFCSRMFHDFGEQRVERVLPDLYCVQAQAGADAFAVLKLFLKSVKEFFPAFLEGFGSPVRMSLAYSGAKHPFFEVWREWQEQEAEIEITAVGHGRLRLEIKHLEKFLRLANYPFRQSALHNLAEISLVSQQLAELRFRSAGERGERETFEHLKEFLPLGLTFDGILTLAKLARR
jgi:hypothetical protein